MKTHVVIIAGCLLFAFEAAARAEQPAPQEPQVFAPETISTGNVFRGCFTPDGRTFYFFKKVTKGKEDYRIFESRMVDGRWTEPERGVLGGEYSDLYPSISADGKRMVFSSYRPVPGDAAPKHNANLWYVDRTRDGWSEPVLMAAASTPGNYNAQPAFGPDGAIYFKSTFPDWKTTRHWITRWNGKECGTPERFEAVERWLGWRPDLHVWEGAPGPDGSFVILTVSTIDSVTHSRGPSDLWVTFRREPGWTEPQLLGSGVNTERYENFVFFSPDRQELYFVRGFDEFYHISLEKLLDTRK